MVLERTSREFSSSWCSLLPRMWSKFLLRREMFGLFDFDLVALLNVGVHCLGSCRF